LKDKIFKTKKRLEQSFKEYKEIDKQMNIDIIGSLGLGTPYIVYPNI
jgi:hypothetical protein